MIVDSGMLVIGDSLANNLGTHIAVGIGDRPVTATDNSLQFEIWRGEIDTRAYDPATGAVHFKSTIPSDFETSVLEVALLASGSGEAYSMLITTVAQDEESWEGGIWSGTGIRMGPEGLNVAGTTATLTGMDSNLSTFSAKDNVQVAYFAPAGGGEVTITLFTDEEDYMAFNIPVTAGYNIFATKFENMTSAGIPDLANIKYMTLAHSGSGSFTLDAIRAVKGEGDTELIQRQIVPVAIKRAGSSMDVEVSINI